MLVMTGASATTGTHSVTGVESPKSELKATQSQTVPSKGGMSTSTASSEAASTLAGGSSPLASPWTRPCSDALGFPPA